MRCVSEFTPAVCLWVILVKPCNMTIPMAVLDTAYHVYFISMHEYTCGATSSLGRYLWSDAPFIFVGIKDVDIWNGCFMRISSRECAKHPHFVVVCDCLKVVHFYWRFFECCPRLGFQVEYFYRFDSSSSEQYKFVLHSGESVLVAIRARVCG